MSERPEEDEALGTDTGGADAGDNTVQGGEGADDLAGDDDGDED